MDGYALANQLSADTESRTKRNPRLSQISRLCFAQSTLLHHHSHGLTSICRRYRVCFHKQRIRPSMIGKHKLALAASLAHTFAFV